MTSAATTYDFADVGDSLPTLREHELAYRDQVEVLINPRTPLKLSTNTSQLFVMNKTAQDAVGDNLKNLLMTNRGERVMQPDFGANLKAILTEYGTAGFESECMRRIKQSVKKYLPYVGLSKMAMQKIETPASDGLTVLSITIEYTVPGATTGNIVQSLTVTLSTIG
jgi:phage baseplate assembly protein W